MAEITQQLSALQNTMSSLVSSHVMGDGNPQPNRGPLAASNAHGVPKLTFSQAVSANISDMVKSAVTDTLREQWNTERNEERDMASVVLYGLPDHGHNIADVHTALKKLHYDCRINACFRLGCVSSSELRSSPPRPIKIILPLSSERNRLLDFSNMQ